MAGVKVGDLAVIVRCDMRPDEVGRIVEVVAIVPPMHGWVAPNGTTFCGGPGIGAGIRSTGSKFINHSALGRVHDDEYTFINASRLRPIRGDLTDESERTDQPIPAEVA